MPDIAIFVVGCWVGVFIGMLIVGLLNRDDIDDV